MPPRPTATDGVTELKLLDATIARLTTLRANLLTVSTQVNGGVAPAVPPAPAPAAAHPLSLWMTAQLHGSIRKLAGEAVRSANGYCHEAEKLLKNAAKEGRTATHQGKADVVVDMDAGESKTMQLKTSNVSDPRNVEKHIKESLGQLAGSGGEVSGDNYRWISTVLVNHPENPWPYNSADSVPISGAAFKAKVLTKVTALWSTASAGIANKLPGHRMTPAQFNASASAAGPANRPNTSARTNVTQDVMGKIYFQPNYDLADGNNIWKIRVRYMSNGTVKVEAFNNARVPQ